MAIPESNGHDEPRLESVSEEKKRWKGHVVVVPYPAQGHINPLMHLCNHLAAHDVLVTFANSQFNHDRILQSRCASPPAEAQNDFIDKGNIRLVGIPDGLGYDEYVANFDVPKQVQSLIDIEPLLVKLVEELQPPVTCIIGDVFVISTPAVARRFGIPHVTFWTQSAASYAAHVFITQNHASLKEPWEKLRREGTEDERLISCVPSCPALTYNELPTFLRACDPSDFIFSYLISNFQMAPHNTFILMNSFEELEEESFTFINTPNMLSIGPLLPSHFILPHDTPEPRNMRLGTSFWVEDEEGCMPWLHQQKPASVLYVSFGSITLMSAHQVQEFASGLEASGCPFLMVVRPEMMVGGASVTFPNGFVDKMRDSGRAAFVAWAPQLQVLAHPSIGGFLTHAGWNSTLESICRGIPLLCWPYFADQMLNARCIVDTWKIGLHFTNSHTLDSIALVTSEEIELKIRHLMDPSTSQEIRTQVNRFSLAAKKAYATSSHFNIKSLLDVISR